MKELKVNIPGRDYSIFIESGSIDNIGENIKKIYKGNKIALVTDENVHRLYGEELEKNLEEAGFNTSTVIVKPGEKSKSIETLKNVYDELLEDGITRSDLIIAFGGGVVGDLAGFAASTLLRGIPFIQIPTSLLAQIDSSVGGKVAVNLEKGKNLVGSFYQPIGVFIDPNFLRTLDERYFHDGMGEVIKYGCIRDRILFDKLANYPNEEDFLKDIEEIIYTCLDIKREIVERDEMDSGERMLLNFGHTLGHGVEKHYNYEKYSHGEAVAIGMYNITKKSEELGLTEDGSSEKIKVLLEKYKLPYEMPDVNLEDIAKVIAVDKKSQGDNINIVLLEKIGKSFTKKIKQIDIKDYI